MLIDTIVAGAMDLAVGDGTNGVNLVRGGAASLKITSGNGTDSIGLGGLFIHGATTVITGAEADTVTTYNSGFGAFTYNAGAGNNRFDVEYDLPTDTFGTIFTGPLTFIGGKDNDTVRLGEDANNPLFHLGTVKLTGGAGTNTLVQAAIHGLAPIIATGFV